MVIFIVVYHSGVVITNVIDSYKFVGMKKEIFLLNDFLALKNVVDLVHERLGWMDEGCKVIFKCQIDIGSSNGPQINMMSSVCNENEWTSYVRIMMKLEIHRIKLFARIIV
jgi:hypothetical protein